MLVTGATGGLGRAITTAFAGRGARVIATGRDRSRGEVLRATKDALSGSVSFTPCDLSSPSQVRTFIEDLAAHRDPIEILVNNAGLSPLQLSPDVSLQDVENTFQVNVYAPMMLVAALAPLMASRGRGAILNITSLAADRGLPVMGVYGATKAALASLTRSWATEFGPSGVRVNAVSPALVSHVNNRHLDDLHQANAARSPAGKPGRPQDVANAVLYLAELDPRHVHGVVLAGRWGDACQRPTRSRHVRLEHELVESGRGSWSAAMIFKTVVGIARETPVALLG